MNPMSRVTVKSEAKTHSRLKLYNYGEHPDMMGRDVSMLEEQVHKACELYEANKEYLSQPASRVASFPRAVRISDKPDLQQRLNDLTSTAQRLASIRTGSA